MINNPPIKNMKVSKKLSSTDSSKNIVEKLNKKTFLLQYLPSVLEYLESEKYINYKNEKLKTAYLIDIIHNMVLKYYFKKENKFVINATILKDKYGYLYNYYINYLIETKIISMVSNYRKGVSSRKYSLNAKIIKSKIQRRYRNKDKVLLKKYKKKVMDSIDFSDNDDYLIGKDIREKLISDLFSVEIQFDRAIFFLDALKDEKLFEGDGDLKIRIAFDKDDKTITISDNGIGMNRQEVMDNIGTIAKSGTKEFFKALTGDQAKDSQLIGQFGVGFYSSFIVADKVTLNTRRAGADINEGICWVSSGEADYTIESIEKAERGTEDRKSVV